MMSQVAPIVTTAMLQSLIAGGICYAIFTIALSVVKKTAPVIKYHLGNIALLVSFISFIQPLSGITGLLNTAPIHSTTEAHATIENQTNIQPDVIKETAALPEPRLTPGRVWQHVNGTITANSNGIMLLYLAGLLFYSARLLAQYMQSRALKTRGTFPADNKWTALLAKTKEQLNINANIAIAYTEKKISPCIIGHAKAVILIPVSIANHLSTEQAEAILLHELAHYKQYDYYVNLVTQCINCLMFFNPFVWLITRQCDKYRELSCDAIASRNNRGIELAETLALIAGMHTVQNRMALNLKKQSPLLSRIQALLNIQPSAKTSPRLLSFALISIITVTGLILAGSTTLFSTEKDNTKAELSKISKEMYEAGNHKYIVVDAVIDDLVQLPYDVEVLYMGGTELFITARKVPDHLMQKYVSKLGDFLEQQGEHREGLLSYNPALDQPLTLDEILNANSDFRKCTAKDRYEAGISTRAWQQVFSELHKDGYVRKLNDTFSMDYGPRAIVINRKPLAGAAKEKYERMLIEVVGVNIRKISGSLTLYDLQKYLAGDNTAPTNDEAEGTGINLQQLKSISNELFEQGNTNYIVADAIIDGILADSERYHIAYKDDVVTIKGKALTDAQQYQYNSKYKKFLSRHRKGDNYYGSTKSTVDMRKVYDAESSFRKQDMSLTYVPGTEQRFDDYVFNEMANDGLIDTNARVIVTYSPAGLFINNEELKGQTAEKYKKLFRASDPDLGNTKKVSIAYDGRKNLQEGPAADEDNALQIAGNQLYLAGWQGYVVADAVRDGYIKPGDNYSISYKNGRFAIAGVKLTAIEKERYERKMEAFNNMHADSVNTSWTIGSKVEGPLTTENCLKEFAIKVGKPTRAEQAKEQKNSRNDSLWNSMLSAMHQEGLINIAGYYRIEYKADGVYVNNKRLEGKAEAKYEPMLQALGYKRGKTKNGMVRESRVDDAPIPDWAKSTTSMWVREDELPAIAEQMYADGNHNFIIAYALHDGIIRQNKRYHLEYSDGVVTIDGKKLPEPYQSKYAKKMHSFLLSRGTSATSYNSFLSEQGVSLKELGNPESPIRQVRYRKLTRPDKE